MICIGFHHHPHPGAAWMGVGALDLHLFVEKRSKFGSGFRRSMKSTSHLRLFPSIRGKNAT
jgi:hypothetical protein